MENVIFCAVVAVAKLQTFPVEEGTRFESAKLVWQATFFCLIVTYLLQDLQNKAKCAKELIAPNPL